MNNKPLTPEEVQKAAEEFFPLFEIVHLKMPENARVEDTLKVMETVFQIAQIRRAENDENASNT